MAQGRKSALQISLVIVGQGAIRSLRIEIGQIICVIKHHRRCRIIAVVGQLSRVINGFIQISYVDLRLRRVLCRSHHRRNRG